MKRLAIVLCFAWLGAMSTAWAAPTTAEKQKAAQSFQVGTAAYAKGDFAGAAAAFEQAALYAPHPSTLLNAAESWELAENPARAAQLCDRVLDTPNLEDKHRQAARKQLARVEKKVGTIVVKAPVDARVELDDKEDKSAGTRFRVATGAHKVKVTDAAGEARTQSVNVAGGETKELDFLTPPPPKPEDTKPSPLVAQKREESANAGPPLASWLCFGAGAVATGVAVYFGVKTLGAKDDFDTHPTTTGRDNFNSARLATDVAVGAAALGFAIGLVLWATAPSNGRTAARVVPRVTW